ncbi:hypothetical protein [Lentilactobacillus kisonensis]|uniref:RES domain-containing protein n=1 Tax=Lentilactobacillus kisonensis DSM 19906 = JCM 15041 TaxID=1423766 RepID=A0A0R1NQX9_9LACO|nr:hypothetical protein [Lentilactobacillus kisonensis]KRL22759.1 hypothetical protein FC98_GL001995 [Lentilactobacillus kisonensis DSM 19906 = JCM 15041]
MVTLVKQIIYHATAKSNWEKIRTTGFKIPKNDWAHFYMGGTRKKPGSLGYGLYGFWEDTELARLFISNTTSLKEHAIIRLTLEVEEEQTLNFFDNLEDIKLFRNFVLDSNLDRVIMSLRKLYRNSFKQHALDGALIESFIRKLKRDTEFSQIDCVISATSTSIYKRVELFVPNGVEYCIRTKKIITQYELE